MTLIHVPRPDKSSINPHRRLNSNIKAQLRQFQEVEASLPSAFKTGIYVGAIRTESEAAEYIKQMTENLLPAHVVPRAPRRNRRRARTMPTPSVSMPDDLSASPARPVHRTKAQESWDVFISHASEDKEAIAAPLAQALLARGLRVWYDDLSLKLGDSLRESIDRGLARSRFGVVILSDHFFQKHWPQQELNGLATREVNGEKVILPVWHGVGFAEVKNYSPMLADRLAVPTKDGLAHVVQKIMDVVNKTPITLE